MSSDKEKDKNEKPFTIIVDGTEHTVRNDIVTFDQVVEIFAAGL